jgi:hypothetical protein
VDEADAQRALDAIGTDRFYTVNIKPAADSMLAALKTGGFEAGVLREKISCLATSRPASA